MHTERNVAERIRPYLKAMERSIEAARQQRTDVPPRTADDRRGASYDAAANAPIRPESNAHHARSGNEHELRCENNGSQPFDPTRLKARPKRRPGA